MERDTRSLPGQEPGLPRPERKYKDRLFRMVFKEKEDLLTNTLENAIYLKMTVTIQVRFMRNRINRMIVQRMPKQAPSAKLILHGLAA